LTRSRGAAPAPRHHAAAAPPTRLPAFYQRDGIAPALPAAALPPAALPAPPALDYGEDNGDDGGISDALLARLASASAAHGLSLALIASTSLLPPAPPLRALLPSHLKKEV